MTRAPLSKGITLLIIPNFVLGAVAIALFAMGTIPLYYLWATLIMWILFSGLGIAVGYHRVFSHRTHFLPVWKENIILACATFAAQGSPIFWVAVHRGYHHRHTDTEKDPHSPVAHGKWHAFVGWLNDAREDDNKVNIRYAIDLLRKPNVVWFHKHYYRLILSVPLIVALYDWKLALAMFYLPGGLSLLQDNLVNVFGHSQGIIGYRNFDTPDRSYNNPFFGYFGWGQGWHNNHHYDPASYDFGKRWWEFDPTRIFLPFLGKKH
jgi:stearoyl-CoA desaturase (delta-9 desaturase)